MPKVGWNRLQADCANCAALCCVAPAFSRSADFAIDKPAGQPCPRLAPDFRCTIHADLRFMGFPGCAAYDCFGAGQRVTRELFGEGDWRAGPDTAARMFDAYAAMRRLHELLWYLAEAAVLPAARPVQSEIAAARADVETAAACDLDHLLALDLDAIRASVDPVLERASGLVRTAAPPPRADLAGADLIGKDLRQTPLRGAVLRGAYLIGADLRGARLDGADLRDALFLTHSQIGSAKGGPGTLLPERLDRPPHFAS
jgi:hypothetical protein